MMIFGKYVEKRVLYPVAAFILVLVIALIAECAAVYTPSTISGATVYGFSGQRTMVEIATEDATITYKVQYRIATVWTDIEPDASSPADVFTVFPGQSDRWTWTYMGAAADSTRLIVTPVSATDVTVRVQ